MQRYIKVQITILLFITFTVLFLSNCTTSSVNEKYSKNGKQYGVIDETFRGEWYHYYKRGISYAAGEFWKEAISDFQKAMDVTQRTVDKRNASTYGMHTIDYFPHRELGVIYYRAGRYEESTKELGLSRDQCDTARARHYLDKARTALVASSTRDNAPPEIKITSRSDAKTNSFSVYVTGVVEDDTFVKSLLVTVDAADATISSEPYYTATSQKKITFHKQVRLSHGVNTIKIEAEDISKKKSEKSIEIEVDPFGPAISFDSPRDGDHLTSRETVLKGVVFDKNGVESLSINSEDVKLARGDPDSFSQQLTLKDGLNTIGYIVKDKVGNETAGSMKITVGRKKAEKGRHESLIKLASAQPPQSNLPILRYSNTPSFQRLAITLLHSRFLAIPESNTQSKATPPPPTIEIESPVIPTSSSQRWPEFYGEELPCNIGITALGGLKSVEINGIDRSDNIMLGRITQEFSQRIPLKVGDNDITVAVEDRANNEVQEIRSIERVRWISEHQLLFQIQKIEGSRDIKGLERRRPERVLIGEIKNTQRFDAVDAGTDTPNIDAFLRGWISEYESGTEVGIEIDVQNLEKRDLLLEPITEYAENATKEDIQKMFRILAERLAAKFPVVQGKITMAGKGDVEISWGRNDMAEVLKLGYRLIIFRYDKNYRPRVTAYAEIGSFRGEKTDANIFRNVSTRSPEKNDLVITK